MPDPAEAQRAGAIEVGAIGDFTIYDSEVGVENAPSIGARAGFFFMPNLAVELDWSYHEPDLTDAPGWRDREFIRHELFQGRITYNHWMSETTALLVGAGYSYDHYTTPRNVGARGGGPGGLLGLRYRFSELFSLRLEGTGYYVPEDLDAHVAPRPSTLNFSLQGGLSVLLRDRVEERIVELPPPPPDTVVVREEVEPPLPEGTPTQLCLATGEEVTVYITPQGDTLVGPRRVDVRNLGPGVAFAGEYAEGRSWFVQNEPVILTQMVDNREMDLEYVRSGGEISLDCPSIRRVGEFQGVPLFADANATAPYETLYVPVRPGVWQAYQTDLAAVRGD
jgi:hypothetical protein